MGLFDLSEISFFELDRLFSQSERQLKKKRDRRRRKERKNGAAESSSPERSRSPPRRGQLRTGGRSLPNTGGFVGKVERVERSIVVTGVPAGADEKTLFRHYSKCGQITDLMCVYGPRGDRTGVAILSFEQDEHVARAVGLPAPFNEILGQPVQAKRADVQMPKISNQPQRALTRQQFTQQVLTGLKGGTAESGPNMRKLHIKNLRSVVREEDLRSIFKPFGDFEEFRMGTQECHITFRNSNDAQDAMTSMQGFQLVGQELQITLMSVTVQPVPPPPPEPPKPKAMAAMNLKSDSDFGSTGVSASNVHNRIELMKKLTQSHSAQGIPTVVGLAVPSESLPTAPPVAAPSLSNSLPPAPKAGSSSSRTLLLQNMFTSSKVDMQKEPRFYDEIREDTHDECAKFGKVVHISVDPRGTGGLIYVLYESPQQRLAAEMALNGRWFEGKKIMAFGIDDSIWQDLAAQTQAATAAA